MAQQDATEKRDLPVKLTQQELVEKAIELAAEVVAQDALQAEKDTANAAWGEQLKAHKKRISELSALMVAGAEARPVECRREYDIPGGYLVRVTRLDTGEAVHERPMTDEERERVRQGDLFPPAEAIGGPEPTKDEAAGALAEVARRAGVGSSNGTGGGGKSSSSKKNDVH